MKIALRPALLALASLPLFGAAPALSFVAVPQEAAEPASQGETLLGAQYSRQLAKLPVMESLLHVHDVLGQAVAAAQGVELTGPRLPRCKPPLDLPPSLRSGAALKNGGLTAVRVASFSGEEVAATDKAQGHRAVALDLHFKVVKGANAPVAADLLGLALASDGRITVTSQSPAASTDEDGWHQVALELRCAAPEGPDTGAAPKQLDAAAAAPSPDAMGSYLRTMAQDKSAQLGSLTIRAPEGESKGTRVSHRFEKEDEGTRAVKLANFFLLVGQNTDHAHVTSFRSERAADGAWKQTFTIQ